MASCSLCNLFEPTKIQYNYDLAREHAKTHLLQVKIIDDEIDMDQMLEKCFPAFRTVKVSRRDLIALCHSLFPRRLCNKSKQQFCCEKCGDTIKITDRLKFLNTTVLIEHACCHLGLNMFECRHCVQEFKSRSAVSMHLVKKHRLSTSIGQFRSKVDDFVEEISEMIKACFSGKKEIAPSSGMKMRSVTIARVCGRTKGSHLALERQMLCYRIIRKHDSRNGNVPCRLCSKSIKTHEGKMIHCQGVREHAYRHFPTPLYRCRLCSEPCFGLTSMQKHLRAAHALSGLEQNYICLADQYHSEIMALMDKCYSDESDLQSTKEIAFRNPNDSKICKKSTRSKLTVCRQILCYRLIRKCANAERSVQCRLCSKRISAKTKDSIGSERVMQHALLHVGKPLYQCKKCLKNFTTRDNVQHHLKKEHALPSGQTYYKCFSDQFHGEIVSILRQCYGGEGNEEDDLVEGPLDLQS